MLVINVQFFGGRGSKSGMGGARAGGAVNESEPAYGGAVRSLNGTTIQQANNDYWSTGVKNKTEIAQRIVGTGEFSSEESFVNNQIKQREKADQAIVDAYNKNPTSYNKDNYDYMMRTKKSSAELAKEYRREYNETRQNALNMAAADVAKRMGYNVSGSTGDYSASALNSLMGKASADALRASVTSNARKFLDSRKRKK